MPFAWSFQRPWEDFFTVVQWDQRGAGKSYALNDPRMIAPTMTLDRYRDDAIELIDYLKARYGKRKVFLLGHSWGSAVGLSVAIKRPDLLHAYIGMGQAIDFRAGERGEASERRSRRWRGRHRRPFHRSIGGKRRREVVRAVRGGRVEARARRGAAPAHANSMMMGRRRRRRVVALRRSGAAAPAPGSPARVER